MKTYVLSYCVVVTVSIAENWVLYKEQVDSEETESNFKKYRF